VSRRALLVAWAMVLGLGVLGPGVAEAGRSHTQYTGVVNLNEASQEELDRLPGVGGKAAERILAHRQKQPFQRIEELVRVKGFGKKKFEKLKPFLTITGPSTLKAEKGSGSDSPKKKKKPRH
jgi:competence protein ComEA